MKTCLDLLKGKDGVREVTNKKRVEKTPPKVAAKNVSGRSTNLSKEEATPGMFGDHAVDSHPKDLHYVFSEATKAKIKFDEKFNGLRHVLFKQANGQVETSCQCQICSNVVAIVT